MLPKFFGYIDWGSACLSPWLLRDVKALRRDIPIWLIGVLSTIERLPNVLKEADSINVSLQS